ncbi:hypothetical protein, partial [Klebsiella pneumoniae]|uniref:hypothetical protein n=1 Tax=Klebsiella pneumoniae TaxID=573 RepID=UPI0013D85A7C
LKDSRHSPLSPIDGPPLELDSDFGAIEGDALELMERRFSDRGLLTRERYSSRTEDGDIVCTARDGERIV